MEVRVQPASPVALRPPDEERRGKGRGEPGRPRTPGASSWRGGERRKGAAPPPLLAAAKEEESQSPYPPPQTQKRPPPPPSPRKQPPAQPRTLAAPTVSRSPVAPASPRPAARPCGPQSARGPRPGVVVRPRPLPRRPPCVAATAGGRRRRGGGGGGGGVLLSRPLPSPELAPNVRARWSEAATKGVLPRCAARAESAAEAAPPPPGALGGLRTTPRVSARRIWCFRCREQDDEHDRELLRPDSCSPQARRPLRTPL